VLFRSPTQQFDPGEIHLWDVTLGPNGPAFKERPILKGHRNSVLTLTFAPDGKTLASAGGAYGQFGEVLVWDLAAAKVAARLEGHKQWVECLAFTPNGRTLLSGGGTTHSTGQVRLWRLSAPSGWRVAVAHADAIRCLAFSADGSLLATGGADQAVRLWDVASGSVRGIHKGLGSSVRALAFSSDGKTLALAGEDKSIALLDVTTGMVKATLPGQTQPVEMLVFAPDGKTLAIGGVGDKDKPAEVRLVDVTKQAVRATIRIDYPELGALAFAPDGKRFVTGGKASSLVQLWDAATGREVFRMNVEPENRPAGTRLVNVNGVTAAQAMFANPSPGIFSAAFDRDGRRLALGLADGKTYLWDTVEQRELGRTSSQRTPEGIAFAADSRTMTTLHRGGGVALWELPRLAKNAGPRAAKR